MGPDWIQGLEMSGSANAGRRVHVEYGCEVVEVLTADEFKNSDEFQKSGEFQKSNEFQKTSNANKIVSEVEKLTSRRDVWPVYVKLTNGKIYGCDLVVSAIGVEPNVDLWRDEKTNQLMTDSIAKDGGILVNDQMESAMADVYCAGDSCTVGWEFAPHSVEISKFGTNLKIFIIHTAFGKIFFT